MKLNNYCCPTRLAGRQTRVATRTENSHVAGQQPAHLIQPTSRSQRPPLAVVSSSLVLRQQQEHNTFTGPEQARIRTAPLQQRPSMAEHGQRLEITLLGSPGIALGLTCRSHDDEAGPSSVLASDFTSDESRDTDVAGRAWKISAPRLSESLNTETTEFHAYAHQYLKHKGGTHNPWVARFHPGELTKLFTSSTDEQNPSDLEVGSLAAWVQYLLERFYRFEGVFTALLEDSARLGLR